MRRIEGKIIEWCNYCDGCGWTEGGRTLKTTCIKCQGTGHTSTCACGEHPVALQSAPSEETTP